MRLSGPEALAIATEVFVDQNATPLAECRGSRSYRGELRVEGDASVPGALYLFRAPRSYTRQDIVELHTIGSPPLLGMLVERTIERGARAAEPGEFTARAFFNGALSLDDAEAVAALIRARSDAQLRGAHRLRDRAPARQAQHWTQRLAEMLALVEADIDFAEEPIEFIAPADLRDRLVALRFELHALMRTAADSARLDVLPTVLLIGPGNAGKSSLMNVLSGTDRAICSAVEGTTRDILTAPVSLPGMDCLLADGAGLTHTDDELIRLAQAMTRETATRVDLLCLVIDLSAEPEEDVLQVLRGDRAPPAVIAANKADLVDPPTRVTRIAGLSAGQLGPVVATSALTGEGIPELEAVIQGQLADPRAGAAAHAVMLGARQDHALASALAALDRAVAETQDLRATLDRADVIAFELREALDALDVICGKITTEDLLEQIFADFCVGK